ncbi:MAG: ATP-binding cassette domain-containing protein [Clostridia bacterium]|nr:ATP-binding cassette domain-containing protein [Clostridia bacterium]
MLQLVNVKKDYVTGGNTVHALKGVNLRFRKNEFVSILGSSGCGKTTMLNVIGGLDHYTSGDLIINGVSTKDYKDRDWDVYRNHRIGFVFQSYNLIPHQTVLANVELALTIAGVGKRERRKRAAEALIKVGLKSEMRKRPNQLSGGQMQRVAIARALVNDPEILLADEPTGALDSVTSVQIMDLIREIAADRLVIMVTHNAELAEEYSTRIVRLQDGLVLSDTNPYTGEEEGEQTVYCKTRKAKGGETLPVVQCPHCKKVLRHKDGKTKKCVCPLCGGTFKVVGQSKADKKGKRERSAMSFGTSLGLSARNLMTKKGRTVITSFAGSIGIISVCLVLALSNGFNRYILKTQEDMLSSYPLEITETTVNMDAIMSGMSSAGDMPELDKIGDKVYVNSFLTNIAQGMTVTNDLSKEYLDYIESMNEAWYTAIVYDNGVNLSNNFYTEVEVEENGNTVTKVMSLSELKAYYTLKLTQQEEKYASLAYLVDYLGSIYGKLPGTTDVTAKEYGHYVLSQYDVIGGGHFPERADEAVLVVGSNNDMTDLTLAQLGFIGEKEFLSLFPQEGEAVGDAQKYETMIDFADIVGKKFILNYNDAVYTPATEGDYLYTYKGQRASLEEDESKGRTVTISGVLRLKDGYNYGCLGSGLYLTEQLYNEYVEKNMQSALATTLNEQTAKSQEFGALSGAISEMQVGTPEYMAKLQEIMAFMQQHKNLFKRAAENLSEYYMSANSSEDGQNAMNGFYFLYGDSALRAIGGKDKVNGIRIYTDNFSAKESILAHLDKWNDTHETGKQVKYTDTVGMMMTMVEAMLDAITYVLVAFTAISLVVSSVMIGIITYVSVVERTKEIGVLRALGARKKDVKNLFNAETFIIGLTSGAFGVGITYLLSIAINAILESLTGIATLASLPISSAIIMVVISIALTLISGLIPAGAAAKKDPVIALRTE